MKAAPAPKSWPASTRSPTGKCGGYVRQFANTCRAACSVMQDTPANATAPPRSCLVHAGHALTLRACHFLVISRYIVTASKARCEFDAVT